jgi:hypothetical protein
MISSNNEYNSSLLCQACVLVLAIILYILYKFKIFKDEDYNKLCFAFSIVLILWLTTITGRYILNKQGITFGKNRVIYDPPESIKCLFGERYCQEGNVTIWTVFHFFIYLFVGMYVPDKYGAILFISIFCEVFENIIGFPSKFIVDPLVNLSGYYIGSKLHDKLKENK